jgi:6-phosphogluconolactonase
MTNVELLYFQNPDELAHDAARAWLDEINTASRHGKPFCVALSGGRIAQKLFSSAAEQAKDQNYLFQNVHFFWADERCVGPADPESNFKLAKELLFAPLKIPENQIHRIHGEVAPEIAAQTAQRDIYEAVHHNESGQPVLDLIFLGLGEDGHVASLFPLEPEAISANPAIYRPVFNSPKPPPQRVTLGLKAIAAARQVWMLASGDGKEIALRKSLEPGGTTPFARVIKLRSLTKIFTDIPPGK